MERADIVWIGRPPPEGVAESAKLRRLQLVTDAKTGLDKFDITLSNARAMCVHIHSPEDPVIASCKSRLIPRALMHGLLVVVISSLELVDVLRREFLNDDQRWRQPTVYTADSLPTVFDRFLDHEPGPRWSKPAIHGDERLEEEERLLLRRAFSDCSEVRLEPLPGGSTNVFQAFAKLVASKAGPHPLPFFVKLDRRTKIRREMENYRDCTSLFIPFYARPNLDYDRSFAGDERGIIAGNFVEHSHSLAEIIEQGGGPHAINSVFDDALRGWRRRGLLPAAETVSRPISQSLGGGAILSGFGTQARQRAEAVAQKARTFGATLGAADLGSVLDGKPAKTHRQALMHGDLHAENVRIRHGQAILIDFASVAEGPLVGDPAALDAALALSAQASTEAIWRDWIAKLYAPDEIDRLPSIALPGSAMAHFQDTIRQVRRVGLAEQMSKGEYANALAVFLIRHAFRKPRKGESEDRRPFLFSVAERIANAI